MFEFDFQIDNDIFLAWRDAAVQAPQTTRVFIEGTIVGDIQRKVDAANEYPGPVKLPIEWSNQIPTPSGKISNIKGGLWSRQKAYYFANADFDGEGNIIPYQRKGTFFDEVQIIFDTVDFNLKITNPNPVERFVTGDDQQKFHHNTGWRNPAERYLDILIEAQDDIIDAWYNIIDWKSLA